MLPGMDIPQLFQPHLSEIQLPPYYENTPIGLLIGYHCPQAMIPLENAAGGADEHLDGGLVLDGV